MCWSKLLDITARGHSYRHRQGVQCKELRSILLNDLSGLQTMSPEECHNMFTHIKLAIFHQLKKSIFISNL